MEHVYVFKGHNASLLRKKGGGFSLSDTISKLHDDFLHWTLPEIPVHTHFVDHDPVSRAGESPK